MKKIICALLTVIFVLALFACDKSGGGGEDHTGEVYEDFGNVAGDYLFYNAKTKIEDFEPVLKYDVHTGEISTLCPDPFCTHMDDNCFFHSVAFMTYIGNKVYFAKKDVKTGKHGIYEFDVDTESGGFIYYVDTTVIQLTSYYYDLYFKVSKSTNYIKLNAKTKETSELKNSGYGGMIQSVRNGKIVWYRQEGDDTSYYITDLDGNMIEDNVTGSLSTGLYKYRSELHDKKRRNIAFDKYLTKPGEEEKLIFENVGPGGPYKDVYIGFDVYDSDKYETEFASVWISDADGTNKKTIISDPDRKLHLLNWSQSGNDMVCGDYIGIRLGPEKYNYGIIDGNDENYENYPECDMLIINIRTGEYKTARYEFG